jgi:hypothetical protein
MHVSHGRRIGTTGCLSALARAAGEGTTARTVPANLTSPIDGSPAP